MDDWKLNGFHFMEHLAIKENMRNKGIGSKILKGYGEEHERAIFEVGRPDAGEIFQRKINKFKDLGYILNNHDYIQPSYGKNKKNWPLFLMSHGTPMTKEEFEHSIWEIHTRVYGLKKPIRIIGSETK